ncbi:MAG: hypothetical protein ACR2QC_07750 [Gammaproteobacteria bacterium]
MPFSKKIFENLNPVELAVLAIMMVGATTGVTITKDVFYPPREYPYTSIDAIRDLAPLEIAVKNLTGEIRNLREQDEKLMTALIEIKVILGTAKELPPPPWQNRIRELEREMDRHQHSGAR